MKTSTLVAALAVGSIFVAGCRDDRALGAERDRAPHLPPASEHLPLAEPAVPGTSDPMATTPSPRAPVGSATIANGTIDRAAEEIAGDDLSTIPELTEPIWSSGAPGDAGAQTTEPPAALDTCPASPGGQERQESAEPVSR